METQRRGSVKSMIPVEPGVISVQYSDRWSAFDRGTSPQEIPGIGKARCACAVKSFKLAHAANVDTHFIEQVDDLTFHVKEFSVPGHFSLSGKVWGRVLPLEWIWRIRAYGSLLERLRTNALKPEDLGFKPGVEVTEGMKLPRLRLECTTKFEGVDRHLSDDEARQIAEIDQEQWDEAWDLLVRVLNITDAGFDLVGFIRPDGKGELGMTKDGRIVKVDVFGTPDEDRIIDKRTGHIYSKDLIRNYLKSLPWYSELVRAKKESPKDKTMWPPDPELPEELVALVSERYGEVARRYAA